MITTVILRGKLGQMFGREFRLDIQTPRDAIHAIDKQKPGLRKAILELHAANFRFGVLRGDSNDGATHDPAAEIGPLELDMLHHGRTIEIRPVLTGSDDAKGWGQLIVGVLLIVAGIFLFSTPFGVPLILAGVSTALGGISQLIAGSPGQDNEANLRNKQSYQFGGPVNVAMQGAALQLPVGRTWCPSVVGSSSIVSNVIKRGSNAIGSEPVDDDGTFIVPGLGSGQLPP